MRASSSRSTLPLRSSPAGRDAVRPRRGVALILTMILTVAFAALAMGAIYLTGNAALIGSSYDRERDYRYGAEAALGIAKSQLNGGLFVLPDSLYSTIMNGATITGADGLPLSRVLVNLYVGPTGSTSGQDGTFGSIVAEEIIAPAHFGRGDVIFAIATDSAEHSRKPAAERASARAQSAADLSVCGSPEKPAADYADLAEPAVHRKRPRRESNKTTTILVAADLAFRRLWRVRQMLL